MKGILPRLPHHRLTRCDRLDESISLTSEVVNPIAMPAVT